MAHVEEWFLETGSDSTFVPFSETEDGGYGSYVSSASSYGMAIVPLAVQEETYPSASDALTSAVLSEVDVLAMDVLTCAGDAYVKRTESAYRTLGESVLALDQAVTNDGAGAELLRTVFEFIRLLKTPGGRVDQAVRNLTKACVSVSDAGGVVVEVGATLRRIVDHDVRVVVAEESAVRADRAEYEAEVLGGMVDAEVAMLGRDGLGFCERTSERTSVASV